ncbi:tRNA (adenosine(37)-N6)-threonylcarbamoyltransferase complex dimerization subunit type 1 TsaB [Cognatilysobacter bugurensis]|uniref:tRNA threonylcarbamoyladenosine biosynthesis protein TsaB n=1 Tax=Cognatilysobacter bugurensis TaxID=543356 RepID=A0A918WB67_9GAMM|nr:tRNA (adenosine(37)-N6)-threonylcarbamoyltransferase complex dimerization subunit type 1 TsaB [Lysobacter bugurensis]GHA88840.1 tRNA (adenosine(37)-N6)-threonylcarbamoyltransferase complex dimerization subunit type 1 TsaB [Lysobacter bugurensis]
MPTTLLAFETSTEACSVALWRDGEVRERFELAPRRHAELALPWADELLADSGVARAQIDAIAVGRGPGAFTGVRLAIAIAQGIALALDRPIVPVSTLAALALQAGRDATAGTPLLAAIDARMDEVYVGAFMREGEGVRALGEEWLGAPGAFALPEHAGRWRGAGTGFAALGGVLEAALAPRFDAMDAAALPHAADIARLAAPAYLQGHAVAPEAAEPAYLRNRVALTLAEQTAARARR